MLFRRNVVAVLPTVGLELHEPTILCWCRPAVDWVEGNSIPLVVHNNPLGDSGTQWLTVRMQHARFHAA